MKTQPVGVNLDLILAHVAADAGHLADSGDTLQFVLNDEVLQAAKFGQVLSRRRLENVIEDLPQTGRVRSERRHDSVRKR